MKRFSGLLALTLCICLLLAGCGGDAKTLDIDPDEVARGVIEKVPFANGTRVEGAVADQWYFMGDTVTEHAIYIDGTGSSAQEVAVLKAASADDADALREILSQRLETLKFQFESYKPGEMAKIGNPVIVVKGNVAVMVLADDTGAAADAVEELLK